MDSKRRKNLRLRTAVENVAAAALGTAVGYSAGVATTKALLTKGMYARYLQSLPRAERIEKLRKLERNLGISASLLGAAGGGIASQRLRYAREHDRKNTRLRDKLAELRE